MLKSAENTYLFEGKLTVISEEGTQDGDLKRIVHKYLHAGGRLENGKAEQNLTPFWD